MSPPPYMPFYVGDYLGDTTHLTCIEHGAYLLLLMAMWRADGRLPDDDVRLARHARLKQSEWRRLRPHVIAFFDCADGQLSHPRIDRERERYERQVAHNRANGARGGHAKALILKRSNLAAASNPPAQPEPQPQPQPQTPSEACASSGVRARATRVPAGWIPDAEDLAVAASLGFDPGQAEGQLAMMRDHEFRRPLSDWSAAYRNWLRRVPQFTPHGGSHERTDDTRLDRRQDNLGRAESGLARLLGDD